MYVGGSLELIRLYRQLNFKINIFCRFSDGNGSKNECLKRKVMNCSIIDIKSLNVGEYCGQVEVNDKINCSTLQTSRSLSNDDSHSVDSVVIENSGLFLRFAFFLTVY